MANIFNIIGNWRKAKDCELLEKENNLLRDKIGNIESEVERILDKVDFLGMIDFVVNPKTDVGKSILNRFEHLIRRAEEEYNTASDLKFKIKEIEKKIQKRDIVTGRFIKK